MGDTGIDGFVRHYSTGSSSAYVEKMYREKKGKYHCQYCGSTFLMSVVLKKGYCSNCTAPLVDTEDDYED